ncbi:MAG: hypothetical protein WA683_06390 [Pseudolabrys sp.]
MTNKNTRKFTSSDDALILQQPVSGVGLNTLAKMIRTSREAIIRRAGELGVSLDISNDHDDAADTRVLRRSDKLVDPLLERLKQVHGDKPRQRRTPSAPVMLDGVPER